LNPTKPTSFAPHEPDEAEIQKVAYHLWIDGGRLEGVELDNWFSAKELLRHRHGHTHGLAPRGAHTLRPNLFSAQPNS
jgi:hypothetical protein